MKRYLMIFLLTFFGLSCRKDAAVNATYGQRYYFYQGQKIYLTKLGNLLTISFIDSTSTQTQTDILAQFTFLNPINTSFGGATSIENFATTSFKHIADDQTTNARIKQLESNPKIRIANLMLVTDNKDTVGITNQFVVHLKSNTTKQDLNQLAFQTHTNIVGRPLFQPDTLTYIMSADKYSNGDALDMANLFFLTGKFEWAEPDLLTIHAF